VGVAAKTRGRSLSIRVRSEGGTLSGLVVTLKRGKTTVATGRRSRVDGNVTVVLKARKSLRKGRYTVVAQAGGISTARKLTLK
jgi:hypothetical protein